METLCEAHNNIKSYVWYVGMVMKMKMRERLKQNNSAFKIASTAKMAVKMVFESSPPRFNRDKEVKEKRKKKMIILSKAVWAEYVWGWQAGCNWKPSSQNKILSTILS